MKTEESIDGLPRMAKGHTVIWIIVDRHTKLADFISKSTNTSNKWAHLY